MTSEPPPSRMSLPLLRLGDARMTGVERNLSGLAPIGIAEA